MSVIKHCTHFCYPIEQVFHQYLILHITYILASHLYVQTTYKSNVCTCHFTLFSDYSDQSLTKLIHQKENFRLVSIWQFT